MTPQNFSISQKKRSRDGARAAFEVQKLERRTLLASSPVVIDVMVLYTPQAATEAGGTPAIMNRIDRAIAQANMAMANSQVNATLRLVHEAPIYYAQSGVLSTDLLNLQEGNGALWSVSALRRQYGADLVSLWVGNEIGSEAGIAF